MNIYRPPNGDAKVFVDSLPKLVDIVKGDKNIDIFVMGDMNINFNINSEVKKDLARDMFSRGFVQYITDITRDSDNPSILDLIFTNCDNISKSGVLHVDVSDHEMVYITKNKILET